MGIPVAVCRTGPWRTIRANDISSTVSVDVPLPRVHDMPNRRQPGSRGIDLDNGRRRDHPRHIQHSAVLLLHYWWSRGRDVSEHDSVRIQFHGVPFLPGSVDTEHVLNACGRCEPKRDDHQLLGR